MTVSDLAAKSDTSIGSVVRFCQELGFRGFQDLKLAIAGDGAISISGQSSEVATEPLGALRAVLASSARAVVEAENTLDLESFEIAATSLASARSVLIVGIGTSAPLVADTAYRLRMIGVRSESLVDAHAQHVAASFCAPEDVCLAISHTGQTRETLETVETAKLAGATTIAVTSFFRSPLTDLCDLSLVAGAAETYVRVEAMASRFAHLAILDGLCAAITTLEPQRSDIASHRSSDIITAHRL